MKAIKIDAEKRRITEVEVSGLADMKEAVHGLIEVGHYFPGSPDVIYVDEEGLLKDPENFFLLEGETEILAGNGLIVGMNLTTGENIDCVTPIEHIKKCVLWMDSLTVELYMQSMKRHSKILIDKLETM